MRYKSRSYYEGLLKDPNVQRALRVIREAEHYRNTADPYRTAVTNKPIKDLSWHPEKAYIFNSKGEKSTAAGAYQFLKGTWNEIATAVGLTDFSPLSQDIAAVARIDWRGGLDNVLAGDFKGFVHAVRNEWASFPGNEYPNQGERSWAFMNRAWDRAALAPQNPVKPTSREVGIARNAGTPIPVGLGMQPVGMSDNDENDLLATRPLPPNGLAMQLAMAPQAGTLGVPVHPWIPTPTPNPRTMDGSAAGGLEMQLSMAPQAGTDGVPAIAPVPAPAPRGPFGGVSLETTRSIPYAPVNSSLGGPAPEQDLPAGHGLLGSPEAFSSQKAGAQEHAPIELNTPPNEYLHPAFDNTLPKVNAFRHAPVPGLRTYSNLAALDRGFGTPAGSGREVNRVPTRESGFDALPADQSGKTPRSASPVRAHRRAPVATGALAHPNGNGLAGVGGELPYRSEPSDAGRFPGASKAGGLLARLFALEPVYDEPRGVGAILNNGPGSASYAGSGTAGIQGIMSSTGPGVANPSIGTVASSRSNPGFSVVGLGPIGYGRQSSKQGWTETVTPFGTSFNPHSAFETTVDPATGRRSVSRVDTRTGKKSVIAVSPAPVGPSRGPARGLASFLSGLFGRAMTNTPAVGPAVASFAPGPTTGPSGFSQDGLGGYESGFGGLGGSLGLSGPAFGGGAHSNSTDARLKMAKNTIIDWDTTAGNNTDIGGINIAEGCPPSGINNGMRETMAQVASARNDGTILGSGALAGHIHGLTLSNGTDADHDIDIAIGSAASDGTTPVNMSLTSAITKQLDASWAVGSAAGGLDTGSIAADTWYYLWLIQRSNTGVVDALFSASATSPTMPTNYDRKRRLPGGIVTDSSSNITPFLMTERRIEYKVPVLAYSSSSLGTTADLSAIPLVPDSFKVKAHFNCAGNTGGGTVSVLVSDPDIDDAAPSKTVAPLGTLFANGSQEVAGQGCVMTSGTGTIRIRSTAASTSFKLVILAWEDVSA